MPCDLRAGQQIYWRRFGAGSRPAVLLHCSLAHSGAWAGLAGALGSDLQMTAFDLPGHGRSSDWDGVAEYQHLSTQIAASFITEPVDLIGHSFGATVALRLAVEQPQKLRSLTLIEPVFFAVAARDAPAAFTTVQPHIDAVKHALAQGDCLAAARDFGVMGALGMTCLKDIKTVLQSAFILLRRPRGRCITMWRVCLRQGPWTILRRRHF